MAITASWEQAGKTVDWVIRGHFVVQLLISAGIGRVVQWIILEYVQVPPMLSTAIWCFTTALVVWALIALFKNREFGQQTALTSAIASSQGIEANLKAISEFYKTSSGPFLDEMEAHFQRLAAHHRKQDEREKFLIQALSSGAVSYLHDTSWAYIYGSQIDALNELNSKGALTVNDLKRFYDSAARAHPHTYSTYTFDQWLGWIINNTLVRQDSGIVQLTVRGKDFLKYLVLVGRSGIKKIG